MKNLFLFTVASFAMTTVAHAATSLPLPQIEPARVSSVKGYKGSTYEIDKRDCSCVEKNLKTEEKSECTVDVFNSLFLMRNSTLFGKRKSLGGITEYGTVFVYNNEPSYHHISKELFGQAYVDFERDLGNENKISLNPKAVQTTTRLRGYNNQKAMMFNSEEVRVDIGGVRASVYKLNQKIEAINDKSVKLTVTEVNEAADLLRPDQISVIKKELGKISEVGSMLTNRLLVGDDEHSVISSEKIIRCSAYRK